MDRRNFISATFFTFVAYLIEACTGVRSTSSGPVAVFNLNDFPALQNVGGGVATLTIQNQIYMATRISEETISVVSQKCTHRGCKLFTQSNGQGFECPCHGSSFDLKGSVTRGPAMRPLDRYSVILDTASGVFKII